jgi:hypothetical protein
MPEGIRCRLEVVEAQLGAHDFGRLKIVRVNRYADGIGNAVVLGEIPGNRRGCRDGCKAKSFRKRLARGVKP